MSESENRNEFAKNLLSQDQPPADKQQRQDEILFKKIKRRIWIAKLVGGAIYVALFLIAFWAFMQHQHIDNAVHAICWGAVSLHILLWFLIYFLRGIYRTLAEITEKGHTKAQTQPWRNQDRFITIVAILVFAYATIFLYRGFFFTDPLEAADLPGHIFWATVFFLFWYPFGTASLLAKMWLNYKRMELSITPNKELNSKTQGI